MAAADAEGISDVKSLTCKICNEPFTDARDLRCGHSFCLHCLQNRSERKCPECDEETIPEDDQKMNELDINMEKNLMVGIEMARRVKNRYWSPKRDKKGDDDDENKEEEEEKVGPIHEGVMCSNCEKKDFAGVRYICGVCPGYNLCEECEDEPKSHKHDKTHIFVKLKRPTTKPLPEGSILTEIAVKMGEAMDFDRKQHMALEKISETIYRKLSGVICDHCAPFKDEIKGIRYNCGNCVNYDLCEECEKRSDIVHDPNHVFLKIRHPVNDIIPGSNTTALLKCEFY